MHLTTGKATYLAVSPIIGIQGGYISPFHSLTSQVAKSLNVVPQKILQGGDTGTVKQSGGGSTK